MKNPGLQNSQMKKHWHESMLVSEQGLLNLSWPFKKDN